MSKLLITAVLCFALPALASPVSTPLAETRVILVGETHGSAASLAFASQLLEAAVREHECVTLAVEIAHSQQAVLDGIAEGDGSIADVAIAPVIGHPQYRQWLADVLARVPESPCLRVIAADLPLDEPGDRDTAMARKIADEVADKRFVIGLFGQLHVSRGVAYRHSLRQSAADRLLARGIDVFSVIDAPQACGETALDAADSARAAAAIAGLREIVNGSYPSRPGDIVDAVLVAADCPSEHASLQ